MWPKLKILYWFIFFISFKEIKIAKNGLWIGNRQLSRTTVQWWPKKAFSIGWEPIFIGYAEFPVLDYEHIWTTEFLGCRIYTRHPPPDTRENSDIYPTPEKTRVYTRHPRKFGYLHAKFFEFFFFWFF